MILRLKQKTVIGFCRGHIKNIVVLVLQTFTIIQTLIIVYDRYLHVILIFHLMDMKKERYRRLNM